MNCVNVKAHLINYWIFWIHHIVDIMISLCELIMFHFIWNFPTTCRNFPAAAVWASRQRELKHQGITFSQQNMQSPLRDAVWEIKTYSLARHTHQSWENPSSDIKQGVLWGKSHKQTKNMQYVRWEKIRCIFNEVPNAIFCNIVSTWKFLSMRTKQSYYVDIRFFVGVTKSGWGKIRKEMSRLHQPCAS